MAGQLVKLLITPVDSDCNMACGYCYNGSSRVECLKPNKVISLDLVYKIFDQIQPYLKGKRLVVIWHGGEPLLAGQEFYREAIKVQEEAVKGRYAITNCMQTNGTLIDEAWADTLADLRIGPSVSIDGPAWLHDKIRKNIDGSPTYEKAMNGYRLLQNRDINTGMLVVVSRANFQYVKEIWEWVLAERIPHFDFLPCIEPELWKIGQQVYGLSTDEVAKFSIDFFDLWFNHGDPEVKIRTFRDAIKGQLGGKVNICSWKEGCLQHISFNASGKAFPCARYHCYEETSMGDISHESFEMIMQSAKTKWVHDGISFGQSQCKDCDWNYICGSGCPFLKYALHGKWDAPFVHCKSRQALFRHVEQKIFV